MKKLLFIGSSLVLSLSLSLPSNLGKVSATELEQGYSENETVLYSEPEQNLLNTNEDFEEIEINGIKIEKPDIESEGILTNNVTDNSKDVDIVEDKTQLLEVTEDEEGVITAEYVTLLETEELAEEVQPDMPTTFNKGISLMSAATDSLTKENWVAGAHGYVKAYYHEQYKKGREDSIDMNYIQVWWTTNGKGAIVSNRSGEILQYGKSHWGAKWTDHTKNIKPTKNSKTQYDVPDAWEPIWEGWVGAKTKATVKNVVNGKTYTLNVKLRLL